MDILCYFQFGTENWVCFLVPIFFGCSIQETKEFIFIQAVYEAALYGALIYGIVSFSPYFTHKGVASFFIVMQSSSLRIAI